MLGNYRVAGQLIGCRVVSNSIELVSPRRRKMLLDRSNYYGGRAETGHIARKAEQRNPFQVLIAPPERETQLDGSRWVRRSSRNLFHTEPKGLHKAADFSVYGTKLRCQKQWDGEWETLTAHALFVATRSLVVRLFQ
jgi:hypothetical protein